MLRILPGRGRVIWNSHPQKTDVFREIHTTFFDRNNVNMAIKIGYVIKTKKHRGFPGCLIPKCIVYIHL